ncbi:hypothetical protein OAU00_03330, partial [Saprospiraceae bacterium]|nr:hypothetical protein [Saprospiraceae bacterium]
MTFNFSHHPFPEITLLVFSSLESNIESKIVAGREVDFNKFKITFSFCRKKLVGGIEINTSRPYVFRSGFFLS